LRGKAKEQPELEGLSMTEDSITISPGPRFQTALILAIIADALQIVIFPAFVEGAISPADDILDFGIAALLITLLGWHWEFPPSFLAKLVPGVDLVPFWTLAVINVYRKSKRIAVTREHSREEQPVLKD
jgi:hypothetical protein